MQMIITNYFQAHFFPKESKRKSPIFGQKHGFNLLKKCQCGDYVKYKICSLGQSSNTTSRPILSKKKQGENVQFLTKIVGFKKIHHGDHIKSIFFSLGKLVLQPDDHQTLFLGLYCPNTNKQEISNFFDQNDWLFLY